MLNYTLVSPKGTYRMLEPRDLSDLVGLVQAYYQEDHRGTEMPPDQVLTTVKELGTNSEKGSVFVFERDGLLVGYALLIRYWSNELGGTVLVVDELYIVPSQRRQGIASDFLGLLGKVAPPGTVAIQLEVNRTDRRALALYRKLGFRDCGRQVFSLPLPPR